MHLLASPDWVSIWFPSANPTLQLGEAIKFQCTISIHWLRFFWKATPSSPLIHWNTICAQSRDRIRSISTTWGLLAWLFVGFFTRHSFRLRFWYLEIDGHWKTSPDYLIRWNKNTKWFTAIRNGSHMQLYTYLNSVTKRLTWLWMKRKKYVAMSISWQVANHSLLLTPLGICFLTGWPGSRSVHVAHETEMRLMKRIIKYRGLNIFHDVENTYYMKMALHQFVALHVTIPI